MTDILLELAKALLGKFVIPWLDNQYGDEWKAKEAQVRDVVDPIFAEMIKAATDKGYVGYILGNLLPKDGTLSYQIWQFRRPFDARATAGLAALGLFPKGNPTK